MACDPFYEVTKLSMGNKNHMQVPFMAVTLREIEQLAAEEAKVLAPFSYKSGSLAPSTL